MGTASLLFQVSMCSKVSEVVLVNSVGEFRAFRIRAPASFSKEGGLLITHFDIKFTLGRVGTCSENYVIIEKRFGPPWSTDRSSLEENTRLWWPLKTSNGLQNYFFESINSELISTQKGALPFIAMIAGRKGCVRKMRIKFLLPPESVPDFDGRSNFCGNPPEHPSLSLENTRVDYSLHLQLRNAENRHLTKRKR